MKRGLRVWTRTIIGGLVVLLMVAGATNQPFVWLRYGGLWSDAEIIVYYYRVNNRF